MKMFAYTGVLLLAQLSGAVAAAPPPAPVAGMWDAAAAAARSAGFNGHLAVADATVTYGEDFGTPAAADKVRFWRWASVTISVRPSAGERLVRMGTISPRASVLREF